MARTLKRFGQKAIGLLTVFGNVSSQKRGKPLIVETEAAEQSLGGLFSDIASEWDKAEEVIKLAEQVTSDVVIPAIAELRYAGRRIIDALNCQKGEGSTAEITAFLEDARFDCHRARHDAIDAALSKMSLESDFLAKKMGYDVVGASFPDFVNFVGRLDAARELIANSRGNRTDRDEIYRAITDADFPGLVQDFKSLRRSEIGMRLIASARQRNVTLAWALTIASWVLTLITWAYPRT